MPSSGTGQDASAKWRPCYHFIAPKGWMNDPCAPGYDAITGTYHLFYQWNPHTTTWTNDISWGHATSRDLVHWKHDELAALKPQAEYDKLGIFTGCFVPTGVEGQEGTLSLVYTAVSGSPLHWTKPYPKGAEKVAIATSNDGGATFSRLLNGNPLTIRPPEGVDITGWRDPFISAWPSMDHLRAHAAPSTSLTSAPRTLYALISGGVRLPHPTPSAFLYSLPANDLTDWTYLGPLVSKETVDILKRRENRWTGELGWNWECCGFFDVGVEEDGTSEGGSLQSFLITGTEGALRPPVSPCSSEKSPERTSRWPVWMGGKLKQTRGEGGSVELKPTAQGVLDWGCFYAGATFWDPVKEIRVLWGWILEDDLPVDQAATQGWSGCFALPRQLFLQTTTNVIGTIHSKLDELESFHARLIVEDTFDRHQDEHVAMFAVETLGIKPMKEVELLRNEAKLSMEWKEDVRASGQTWSKVVGDIGLAWELEVQVDVGENCKEVGVIIHHRADEYTTITFEPHLELITVDRSHSTLLPDVNVDPEVGSHTLFRLLSPSTGDIVTEPLKLHIFFDNSVLEVYANERFALSTRVYPTRPGGQAAGKLEMIAKCTGGEEAVATFKQLKLWDGSSL